MLVNKVHLGANVGIFRETAKLFSRFAQKSNVMVYEQSQVKSLISKGDVHLMPIQKVLESGLQNV